MERKRRNHTKRIVNLIIVDESGSMSLIKKQALMGLNETLDTVKRMQEKEPNAQQYVTLLTFNSDNTHYVFDNTPAKRTHTIRPNDYQPSGCTPLYDAIGRGVSKVNAQTSTDDVVLVTIITDGEENSSTEFDLRMVKQLIEKMKTLKWTFTFIGTDNLDVEGMAGAMAIDNHLEFKEDEAGTERMFACERRSRARYNERMAFDIPISVGSYFDEDETKSRKE